MPITHEQKADLGQRYVKEIKRRIAVRDKAMKVASWSVEDDEGEEVQTRQSPVDVIARTIAKKHKIPFVSCKIDSTWRGGKYHKTCKIAGDGFELVVPFESYPALINAAEIKDSADKLRKDLCQELEFLHTASDAAHISAFQTYVSRVWAPRKDERLAEGQFGEFVNDYLLSKHTFVCKVA